MYRQKTEGVRKLWVTMWVLIDTIDYMDWGSGISVWDGWMVGLVFCYWVYGRISGFCCRKPAERITSGTDS